MLHELRHRFAQWQRTRRDIRRLSRLDDRLLADVGVDRRNIVASVKGVCE